MQKIYLVNQTQPNEEYYDTAIYACSTFERAQKYARHLNKEYGEGCVFDDNWDFVEYDMRCEPHYYTIEEMVVDEPLFYVGKNKQSNKKQKGQTNDNTENDR